MLYYIFYFTYIYIYYIFTIYIFVYIDICVYKVTTDDFNDEGGLGTTGGVNCHSGKVSLWQQINWCNLRRPSDYQHCSVLFPFSTHQPIRSLEIQQSYRVLTKIISISATRRGRKVWNFLRALSTES